MSNVPKLRFSEFKEEWFDTSIGDGCSLKAGKFVRAIEIIEQPSDTSYPCYGGNGLRGFVNSHTHDGTFSLIGRQGALCGNVQFASGKFHATEHAVVVKPSADNDSKWLFYLLGKLDLNRYATGQAQPGLSVDVLNAVPFSAPGIKEQQKIADFITAVDTKIEQLTRKEKLLKQYKKGVMQKIFSKEIRFKADDGSEFPEWNSLPMGELGKTFNGLTGKTGDDFGKGQPYIQYKQIFDNSKIDLVNTGLVTIVTGERQQKAKYGDVFFTTSSETPREVAYASVLLDQVDNLYLNSFCFGYRANSLKQLLPEFSRYYFRSEKFRRDAIKLAQGSTRYNISKTELMKTIIDLPCIDEQRKVALCLTALDDKIELVFGQLDKAKTFKKGLLQQMFV